MKKCPECGREYDNTMMFCLDDGAELLYGPASGKSEPPASAGGQFVDEPQTAILSEPGAVATGFRDGDVTRAQVHTNDQTAIFPLGAEAEPQGSLGGLPEKHSFSARRAAKPLIAAVVAVAVLIGGFVGYRYFSSASSKQIDSIAVMPFVNESGNADIEYLSDGITETLIGSLSQIPDLSVKARSSVFRYKGKDTAAQTIGKELNVQAVLTGRVAQRGDQLIVSLELVDASTENAIWSERYDRKQSDLVALLTEIARDVSGKLKAKLSGADEAKVAKNYTTNPEAYTLYLKARFFWNKRTSESLKQASEFYKQAIEKDPTFARAYAGLAENYVIFPIYSLALPKDIMPEGKAMALRALEIDDSLAEAHAALGSYLTHFEFDRIGAEREYRRAIELNPNYATAHQWLGNNVLNPTKRFDEGLAALRRAEELDPLSPIIGTNLGDSFVYTGNYDKAISQYKRILELDPNFAFGRFALGWCLYVKGTYQDAVAELRRSLELNYDPTTKGYLAMSLAKSGQRGEALKLLDELKKESSERYVSNIAIAVIYIGLDQKEEALNWLERDVAAHASYSTFIAVDPVYDALRSNPRFKEMLKRLNLPE